MREYSQFQASFWTGETGKKLQGNADAQLLAAYLFTCRHSNQIGLYYLPLMYASHELGMGIDRVSSALEAVSACGFAMYDTASEHVWVFKMAPKQITRSPKAIQGGVREVRIAADSILKRAFIATYGAGLENLHTEPQIRYPELLEEQNKTRTRPRPEQDQAGSPAGAPTRVCDAALPRVAADLDPDNEQQASELAEPPIGGNLADAEPGETDPPRRFDDYAQQNAFIGAYLASHGTYPSMGGKHVGSFHVAVVATAQKQGRDPRELFTSALRRWLDRGLDQKALQFPYACFCAAWGELTSTQPPKTPDPPRGGPSGAPARKQAPVSPVSAYRNRDVDPEEQIRRQEELYEQEQARLFAGGTHG